MNKSGQVWRRLRVGEQAGHRLQRSERVAVATNKERQVWRRVRDGENPGRIERSERR